MVGGGFKANHRFLGPGIAEFFAGQPFDGFRVVAQRLDFGLELFGPVFLLLQLFVQPHDFPAHPFVLADEGQMPHPEEQEQGKDEQANHHFGQLAPDAEVNIHPAS